MLIIFDVAIVVHYTNDANDMTSLVIAKMMTIMS